EKRLLVFVDAIITRMGGWIQRDIVPNELGYLDFKYSVPNNMRIYIDPETRQYDLSDCGWVIKEGWYSLEEIKEKWGIDKNLSYKEADLRWWEKVVDSIKKMTSSSYSKEDHYDKYNDKYRVYEMQERTEQPCYILFNGEGYEYVFKSEYDKNKDLYEGYSIVKSDTKKRIKLTTISPYFDDVVLEDGFSKLPINKFDVFPAWCYNFNIQKSETTSLGELLIDPQDDLNVSMSQIREFTTQSISSAMFVPRDKKLAKDIREKGNAAGTVYDVKSTEHMPKRMPPENLQQEIFASSQGAISLIGAISGVQDAILGREGKSSESGALREKKVESAAAAINDFFHNLWIMDLLIAKDFVDLFPYVYSEKDRVIRIKQGNGQFEEQILNLELGGKILNNVENLSMYVEIDQGEDSVSVQEGAFEKWLALANVIASINPQLVDVRGLVEKAPIPEVDEWIAHIDKVLQQEGEESNRAKNLMEVKQQLENLKIERDMITDEQKVEIERMKAQKEKNSSQPENAKAS
ncbi:MAG: hypothetical protein U9O94_02485, partial [Nanoarchaeota archaeon]|nr:hypothetical protein [Nanoarchaeota archaeon]